jgi:hypothetical protein
MRRAREAHTIGLLLLGLMACSRDESPGRGLPYRPATTVVIGADSNSEVYGTPAGDACVELDGNQCLRPQRECGPGAYADVLLDHDGNVVEVVCLPVEDTTPIVDVRGGVARIPDNGAVVRLDGPARRGDITVQGNTAVVYGDSPAKVVIDGDLMLRGNTSTVRGVTITGNVEFEGNTAALYYCVVYGDVILRGNENLVSNCVIHGSIRSSGNEDRLIANYLTGAIRVEGAPDECRDNRLFTDTDRDRILDDAERTDARPLECEKK